jgi:hypothetical protein
MNHRQAKRNTNNGNEGKGKGKDKKSKYDWKKLPPQNGKPNTYVWPENGKTYHWRPNHKLWTLHSLEECTKGLENDAPVANNNEDEESDAGQNHGNPCMQIDPALQAIVNCGGFHNYD